ncbi:hypothetical protein [Rubellimicrobium sp. CFH 75288]|uniref:hypothetical protein n=1 Tax=Rubellimicrobium sp. CFH 75288 TaxID=2697034 RepID=UPI001411CC4C|nr:hypothetical protein [Rubellimicrobium sp. CFH 75288]NAZ37186.1 hypothetical protein [Rubellimicrobium sp. CFH 75288]
MTPIDHHNSTPAKHPRQPSYRLTFEDAVEVWRLHWTGWLHSRIAARFDVNQGRISEVLTGKRYPGSEEAARKAA